MQYLFKCLFLLFIISKLATSNSIGYLEICIVLIIIASNIVREKYINSVIVIIFEFIIITYGTTLNPDFSVFYGIICFDLVTKKKYLGVVFTIASVLYLLELKFVPEILLIIGICSLLSHLNNGNKSNSELLRLSFDKERKYNHELELTKVKLMNSSADAARIAEVNERNRIAREIHDNIGHSIAGVLMLLQASFKLFDRDNEKSKDLLAKSIQNLSEGLTLLKNTVYNIKPNIELGINYISEIINNFSFCEVDLEYSGNFNNLLPDYAEILGTNIKEALTNASKYSKATLVKISIDINENYIRLYIKDNGVGCYKINESLGLSGMKERIKNVGGNISINGEDGFLIVNVIPLKREVGGMFEGINS
jgi:signal transduction histidine kinase